MRITDSINAGALFTRTFAIEPEDGFDEALGVVQDRVCWCAWRGSLPEASRADGRRSPPRVLAGVGPVVPAPGPPGEEAGEVAVHAGHPGWWSSPSGVVP